ncbi:MAG: ADP-ribosylglycohydrolase family protein [Clostridia bacterium]|nr:ADP-ribosylglycohydrolase family protein [Clostridia bacterium]
MLNYYVYNLPTELLQAQDEGKDITGMQALVDGILAEPDPENRELLAYGFWKAMASRPTRPDYPYTEPSVLSEIRALRPKNRPVFAKPQSADPDKILGAWLGRSAGCLLGKPVEGWMRKDILQRAKDSGNYPIIRYLEDQIDCMPNDDDTNYTMIGLALLEQYGFSFTTADVAQMWLSHLPAYATFTAEITAYRNVLCGVSIDKTATTCNPYREWIGAQIRADIFGYVCPGDPQEAAELAYRDAALSHVKNGIYGEMFAAAMLAAAAVTSDFDQILSAGLGEIPENCRLRKEIDRTVQLCRENEDYTKVIDEIHRSYPEERNHNRVHTIPNAMIVVMALYYGRMDYTRSVGIAVEGAMDTDCNGATVGSIVGMAIGAKNLPDAYIKPLNDTMHTQLAGFDGASIKALAARTCTVANTAR